MRLEIVKTVFLKELREVLRDRRSLLVMFGLPLVLYPLIALVMAGVGVKKEQQYRDETAQVAVIRPEAAPHLIEMMQAKTGAFTIAHPDNPPAALAAGRIHAIVSIPPDFERRLLTPPFASTAATPPDAPAAAPPATRPDGPAIAITVDRSRSNAPFVESKINTLIDRYQQWIIESRLAARQIPPDILSGVSSRYTDIATSEQRLGKLLAIMLPLLLLMTGMLGALFPALHATTTERELGTLETLLVTPAGRLELLAAKGLLVLLSGLLTSALNMISMSLVLWRVFSIVARGGSTFGIDPLALSLSYLAAVPALLFFSTVVLIVGLIARNYREANSFATPVMLLPLIAGFVAMVEPPTTVALMVTPVVNTTLIIRDVLTERVAVSNFLLAFGSSAVYAGLMLSVAVRLFSNEQLVNPAWEPVSLGLGRRRAQRPRRLPNMDGVLALFCASLLLTLYITPSWRAWSFLQAVVGTELLLIALPAILWGVIARYRWQETYSLRVPGAREWPGAILIGVGLIPIATWLQSVQNLFWPASGSDAFMQLLDEGLRRYPVLLPVLTGALAGICEELLYRGPVQAGFLRRFPAWFALSAAALLFSLAHLDMHGAPIRFLLGLALGWMVYRNRTIFPAMLAHALFDAVQLGWHSWELHHPSSATQASPESPFAQATLLLLAAGTALAALGFFLYTRRPRPAAKPAGAV